jgi:hypothetical protein
MKIKLNRRGFLRGSVAGMGAYVALPFLDIFLNTNGNAFADGRSLPPVFGHWFQHLGMNPGRWEPIGIGANYENNHELKVLDSFKDRMNVFSGMEFFVEGRPLETHTTGAEIATMGHIPVGNEAGPSLDYVIANSLGGNNRFRSIEVSLAGTTRSYSKAQGPSTNPSEPSPAELYLRLFGPGFTDPNSGKFTPDPSVMARQSVLTAVADERRSFMKRLGHSDQQRMEQYFTAIRDIERQLMIQMQEPEPLEACVVPQHPGETPSGTTVDVAERNCKLFGALMAQALACGQTQVFNVMVGSMGMRQPGSAQGWHILTHEEPIDEQLGYQRQSTWFINWANGLFADFLRELDGIQEGAGTVLDRTLVLWQTDHGDARVHSLNNIPALTVGSANGRIKTGRHVAAPGDPVTRVGLTVQQALGVPIDSWGEEGNRTSRTISEIMV